MTAPGRYLGIDVGAENVRLAVVEVSGTTSRVLDTTCLRHGGHARKSLADAAAAGALRGIAGAAATGRMASVLNMERVPVPRAMAGGFRAAHPAMDAATLVNIGSRGFGVLEMRTARAPTYRQNGRCSQGTGNFLCQLTTRLGLDVEEASRLCESVPDPAPLSGRCPVILKTDMTHLANSGVPRAAILAGLFDAVAENVEALIKPVTAPRDVYLCGGVTRCARIRAHLRRFLDSRDMRLHEEEIETTLFYEAVGAAHEAARMQFPVPEQDCLLAAEAEKTFERVSGLQACLDRVTRRRDSVPGRESGHCDVAVGFDVGSTGSKAVAVDVQTRQAVWQHYVETSGDPVGAARALASAFLDHAADGMSVRLVGATGSGREIVGSMLRSCCPPERVIVLNEIAAHAAGALQVDPEVDTIFEIGGQDAKYIRLENGEVCEAAMNEACSAGTGSFIEEQGKRLAGSGDVTDLAAEAMQAESGVSLGQHCSVFMAEVVEEALSAGVARESVVAGLYDAVIRNYLNRVKGTRPIGRRIFCQGMPFSSPALAAAVARQTGRDVVVPPSPGFVGAMGVALLALRDNRWEGVELDLGAFREARLLSRDTFVCKSRRGCGGAGNRCRIDRLRVSVGGRTRQHLWGGGCSLYDRGSGTAALPDMTPDPMRDRREAFRELLERVTAARGLPTVGMTDEFVLKGLFPFFATFIRELGFDIVATRTAGRDVLKRGIEQLQVPMCAPMQLYAGVLADLVDMKPDHLFLPLLRDLPRVGDEPVSTACPLSQGSQDVLAHFCERNRDMRVHRSLVEMGQGNLHSKLFQDSLRGIARGFGVTSRSAIETAFRSAVSAQEAFERCLAESGRKAIAFAERHGVVPVVVLGRPYTVHNDVLNSNVPRLLRELGALAIPVDCYPTGKDIPRHRGVYWGYGQANARTAREVRRTSGHYAVFCSNYSCGPDSFVLHVFAREMSGKPYTIIETDGHSGDAGTKTRLEAFLYCVQSHRRRTGESGSAGSLALPSHVCSGRVGRGVPASRAARMMPGDGMSATLGDVREAGETLLIPRMGQNAGVLAACLRADGFKAEALPVPDRDALALGRKYTSGKECLPAAVTLGSFLQRLNRAGSGDRFALFMPSADGPCRFGMYNVLHRMVLDESGWRGRARVVSQHSDDYFDGISAGLAAKAFAAFVAGDILFDALLHTRPVERVPGQSDALYERWYGRLIDLLDATPTPTAAGAVLSSLDGALGLKSLLGEAAPEFAETIDPRKRVPSIAVVGEIYVRLDPFSNDFVVRRLERRGVRAKLAPFHEWLDYVAWANDADMRRGRVAADRPAWLRSLARALRDRLQDILYNAAAEALEWPARARAIDSIRAASDLVRDEVHGEAVLTLGYAIHEFRRGAVQGAVSVGPLECMPNRVAEAQFYRVAERYGLPVTTLSLNGEPMDTSALDDLTYDVLSRFRK